MTAAPTAWSDTALDRLQLQADPLADRTIARILGPWPALPDGADAAALQQLLAPQWKRLAAVTSVFGEWTDNRSLQRMTADRPDLPPEIAAPLADYVREASRLPDWADRAQIERTEALFMGQGVLSCTLLFCASLPECYVVPDLAETLHTTGQLEDRTEYRIRSTAAMIFPVMMTGGLTQPEGAGIAQVLKVRLIHATVRHLILRMSPEQALQALQANVAPRIAPLLALARSPRSMYQALFARGWDVPRDGLPCNQEEMAYTLLTFGYVYLRGLRRLHVPFSPADERACLHSWNVVGHLAGIDRALMCETMDEAEEMFARMQARGRAQGLQPDPRPHLGQALMHSMERLIPLRLAKPIPALLTRHLCGDATARDIGIDGRVSWVSRALFALGLGVVRVIDTVGRLFSREFSIARCITRVVGYRFLTAALMNETRPLVLPEGVQGQALQTMADWGHDPQAPRWLNALEDRLTRPGRWTAAS